MIAVRVDGIEIAGLPHAHVSGPLSDRFPQKPIGFPVAAGDRLLLPGGVTVPQSRMVGDLSTTPTDPAPRFFDHGGNTDCTEVRPGNTLYPPVFHEGELLVLGDVYAAQDDAEMFGEAAECAAEVTVTLTIDRHYRLPRPMVKTTSMSPRRMPTSSRQP